MWARGRRRGAGGDLAALRNRELDLTGRLAALQAAQDSAAADITAADRKLETAHRELAEAALPLKITEIAEIFSPKDVNLPKK